MVLMCCAGMARCAPLLELLDHFAVLLPATAADFVLWMLRKGTWGRGRALCWPMFWSRPCAAWQTWPSRRGCVRKLPAMPIYPALLMCWAVRFHRLRACVLCASDSNAASDSCRSAVEEELVLNAVAAAHNLVYASQPDNGLWVARLQLLPLLVQRLFDSNAAIVAEAASAMANLCVADDVRVAALRNRALQACVMLLDHSDVAVCCAVCGLIMNVSANPACAAHLLQARAHFKLVEAAVANGYAAVGGHGGTSSTACRALANVRGSLACAFNG